MYPKGFVFPLDDGRLGESHSRRKVGNPLPVTQHYGNHQPPPRLRPHSYLYPANLSDVSSRVVRGGQYSQPLDAYRTHR
jgi:hypothetical protein